MTRLVVLQPSYMPWLGYFNQMAQSDIFVYYDDVQFDKHGWRNRNRVKAAKGPLWLSVPVLHKGAGKQRILDVRIDQRMPWANKHLRTIRQEYANAPFLKRFLPELEELLSGRWECLVDLDIAVTSAICRWLGFERPTYRSSELGVAGARNERLLALCHHFGAQSYLSGDAAKSYLDTGLFARHGVTVEWHNYRCPTYSQLHGEFVPNLSVIDLLLNAGEDSFRILASD